MEIVKSSNVMESFGLISVEKGFFTEVDELELVDVIGGSCGAGSNHGCTQCYQSAYVPITNSGCAGGCYQAAYITLKLPWGK